MKIIHIHEYMIEEINDIYESLKELEHEYPDFHEWYYLKVVPHLESGNRRIIAVMDKNVLAAVMILKNEINEKKVCTLRVNPDYRSNGIGTELLKMAINILGCKTPLITVPESHMKEFSPLFCYLGFQLYCVYSGYYINGVKEYSFNGPIEKVDIDEKCA